MKTPIRVSLAELSPEEGAAFAIKVFAEVRVTSFSDVDVGVDRIRYVQPHSSSNTCRRLRNDLPHVIQIALQAQSRRCHLHPTTSAYEAPKDTSALAPVAGTIHGSAVSMIKLTVLVAVLSLQL